MLTIRLSTPRPSSPAPARSTRPPRAGEAGRRRAASRVKMTPAGTLTRNILSPRPVVDDDAAE